MIFIIDLFCGAGGFTTGASQVPGVEVIACVNHDENAIRSHKENHPYVLHFTEDVRDLKVVNHLKALVSLKRKEYPDCTIMLWASVECTNFSNAKGGLPREADSRTLGNCLIEVSDEKGNAIAGYIPALNPDIVMVENVREFMAWGPLDENGKPISRKKGEDYLRWVESIKSHGYAFDYKLLNSADFGAIQSRTRYFAQFVSSSLSFSWPSPTHAKSPDSTGLFGTLKKWRAVREVLDFDNKGKSIFGRKKPLSENTLKRILAGLTRYVADGDTSFIKQYNGGNLEHKSISTSSPSNTITTQNRHALVQPEFLIQYYGNSGASDIKSPCNTITTKDRFAAVFLDKQYSGIHNHQSVNRPASTVLTNDKHSVVQAEFIMDMQFGRIGKSVNDPSMTLIARMDKKPSYLVQCETTGQIAIQVYEDDSETTIKIKQFMAVHGIRDIYMRMLTIPELKLIQGFPKDYILYGTIAEQKKYIGNAVEVTLAKHLTQAIKSSLSKSIIKTKAI